MERDFALAICAALRSAAGFSNFSLQRTQTLLLKFPYYRQSLVMLTKPIKLFIIFALAALIGYIIFDSVSQPNVGDLRGNFKEVAMYRNANNTGPVVRIYAVTVQDTLWNEMEKFGNLMPYTKYGSTKAYFFREGKPVPSQLEPGDENFDASFQASCLAVYEKDANGQVSLIREPFRR